MDRYQRFLTPKSKSFDPLELANETEKLVNREGLNGLERKYVGIYSAFVYGGITTGYVLDVVCAAFIAGVIGQGICQNYSPALARLKINSQKTKNQAPFSKRGSKTS